MNIIFSPARIILSLDIKIIRIQCCAQVKDRSRTPYKRQTIFYNIWIIGGFREKKVSTICDLPGP